MAKQDRSSDQYAIRGRNDFPAMLAHSGTANSATPQRVIANTAGYLGAADFGLEASRGNVTGVSLIHKFGAAPDFDTGDNEVTIWDGADDEGVDAMDYTYSTTADITSISSAGTGDAQVMEIQGLDGDWNLSVQNGTLDGQNTVTLGTSLIRVFRMKNQGATDLSADVYCYVGTAQTAGVPDTATDVRGVVQSENNQTEMAVYTIPNGKTGYLNSFYVSTAGASRSAEYLFKLKARPTGGVFQLKHKFAMDDSVSTNYQHFYKDPQKFSAKTDLVMTCDLLTASITGANVIAGFDLAIVDD